MQCYWTFLLNRYSVRFMDFKWFHLPVTAVSWFHVFNNKTTTALESVNVRKITIMLIYVWVLVSKHLEPFNTINKSTSGIRIWHLNTFHCKVFLTLSKSFKGFSKLSCKMVPSMGKTGGPGGKFFGLLDLTWRKIKKMQIHSSTTERNMVIWGCICTYGLHWEE